MTEEQLLTGPLEPTNEAYALAKIAGIKLCQTYRQQYGCDFISAMPTNLYGPHDNFDLDQQPRAAGADAQVPRRQGGGRDEVEIWGTGNPAPRVPPRRRPRRRLPVPDGALRRRRATSTSAPARTSRSASWPRWSATIVHPDAELVFDTDQARRHAPQAARRVAACTPLGWRHRIELAEGIEVTYDWFLATDAALVRGL